MRGVLATTLLALLALCVTTAGSARAATEWEDELQDEVRTRAHYLILALDTPAAGRGRQVEILARAARGRDGKLILDLLHHALFMDNPQVQEGVIDVLARVTEPRSVPVLARQLAYAKFADIRLRILRLLPVFLLRDDPAARSEFLRLAERENYSMTDRVRRALRRGPFRPATGEFSSALERMRADVIMALSGQLDAIGTAIEGVDTKRDDVRARMTLVYYCGSELGRNREECRAKWRAINLSFQSRRVMELTALETLACKVLSDVGAEGSPRVIRLLARLTRLPRHTANEAGLLAVRRLARLARADLERYGAPGPTAGANASEAAGAWRRYKVACARRMLALAWEAGRRLLASREPAVRTAAYLAVGASGNPAAAGLLSARLLRAGEPAEVQAAMATALGGIGDADAVKVLRIMLGHWTDPDRARGGDERFRVVQSIVLALGAIAGAYDPATRGFHVRDPFSGKLALEALTALLNDRSVVEGAPARPGGEPLRLQDLVLRRLQVITGVGDESRNPRVWRKRYEQMLLEYRALRRR